jgi:hypothetical protein
LVFRLGCTYNNCRGLHHFYIQNKKLSFYKNHPQPSLSLFTYEHRELWPTQIKEHLLYQSNPHCDWERNNPHYTDTTPIVLYFKVYVLILFYFQDLTMLLLFRSCFNFLFFPFLLWAYKLYFSFLLMSVSDQQKVRALRVLQPISRHSLFSLKR